MKLNLTQKKTIKKIIFILYFITGIVLTIFVCSPTMIFLFWLPALLFLLIVFVLMSYDCLRCAKMRWRLMGILTEEEYKVSKKLFFNNYSLININITKNCRDIEYIDSKILAKYRKNYERKNIKYFSSSQNEYLITQNILNKIEKNISLFTPTKMFKFFQSIDKVLFL